MVELGREPDLCRIAQGVPATINISPNRPVPFLQLFPKLRGIRRFLNDSPALVVDQILGLGYKFIKLSEDRFPELFKLGVRIVLAFKRHAGRPLTSYFGGSGVAAG